MCIHYITTFKNGFLHHDDRVMNSSKRRCLSAAGQTGSGTRESATARGNKSRGTSRRYRVSVWKQRHWSGQGLGGQRRGQGSKANRKAAREADRQVAAALAGRRHSYCDSGSEIVSDIDLDTASESGNSAVEFSAEEEDQGLSDSRDYYTI